MKREKLLLHSCCAPCSTSVIEKLLPNYNITVFYYNPNIYPQEEYLKRLNEEKRYITKILKNKNVHFLEGDYCPNDYEHVVKGFEMCKEGGERCEKCFYLRLEKTAQKAKELGCDLFATTLSVSPHKNVNLINQIGEQLQQQYMIKFLNSDFKKQNGYLRSIQISKENDLYRQKYCGCKYSLTKND